MIMKVVISWGIRFIMLHGLCSSPARVQNPVTRKHLQCFPEPGICSSTPFEIWLMHPTHRPTHQACLEHLSLEKNHEKSHPTPFQVSSEILWYPLIHPLIHGAGSSWFIVAGWTIPLWGPTLIGHQPQDIFLAIKHLSRLASYGFVYGWKLKAQNLALYGYIHNNKHIWIIYVYIYICK